MISGINSQTREINSEFWNKLATREINDVSENITCLKSKLADLFNLSYLILSYLILSYLILSYLILPYLILSYLILSYLFLSFLFFFFSLVSFLLYYVLFTKIQNKIHNTQITNCKLQIRKQNWERYFRKIYSRQGFNFLLPDLSRFSFILSCYLVILFTTCLFH